MDLEICFRTDENRCLWVGFGPSPLQPGHQFIPWTFEGRASFAFSVFPSCLISTRPIRPRTTCGKWDASVRERRKAALVMAPVREGRNNVDRCSTDANCIFHGVCLITCLFIEPWRAPRRKGVECLCTAWKWMPATQPILWPILTQAVIMDAGHLQWIFSLEVSLCYLEVHFRKTFRVWTFFLSGGGWLPHDLWMTLCTG